MFRNSQPRCPDCGRRMGLVTFVGEQPVCAVCAGATTTDLPEPPLSDTDTETLSDEQFDQTDSHDLLSDDEGCLHEALEESLPPSQQGGAHNLVCNCPKCRVVC